MMKKKGKSKAAGKRGVKKNEPEKNETQELHPEETWKDVAALVESHATEMVAAVIGAGKQGQVAPVKYLFEMAKIQAPVTDENQKRLEEEDCLAKTLLDRLHVPKEPVVADQEDEDEIVMQPAKQVEVPEEEEGEFEESKENHAGTRSEAHHEEDQEVAVLV